ncbi:MAG: hypothetical protein JSU66_14140 [Deltaproteobacteria bacterium]|nr:MAG: hypothetical protein JSU66_14140 [Deltaproteobacteria bacterium]
MAASNSEEIDRLLREGLNHYGTGDTAEAARCWRAVLELEPDQAEARDYLETAGMLEPEGAGAAAPSEAAPASPPPEFSAPGFDFEAPRGESGEAEPAPGPPAADAAGPAPDAQVDDLLRPDATGDALFREAKKLFEAGELEAALDLFESVVRSDAAKIEVQSYVEMLRSQLLKRYRERIGTQDGTPRLLIEPDAVMKFNLPTTAGFVLSLVDGATRVRDLMSLSGLDAFDTLRILTGLMDAGIVEIEP